MSDFYSATYSPEDNKLRLYAVSRLDAATYALAKSLGFAWAPKQELFVAPSWGPAREDFLLELAGEVDDEDYSPQERAADRAERFGDYRDKRAAGAGAGADRFDSGPSAFGHQNRGRAERQAARHDRHRTFAVSQWSKAEYWQTRTAAVIAHTLFRSDARVRRGRILRLEAEQRKHEKTREEYAARHAGWRAVPALEGADRPGRYVNGDGKGGGYYGFDPETITPALWAANALANSGHCWGDYAHPRTGCVAGLYSHLTDQDDPLTPAEAAALWLDGKAAPDAPGTYAARWSDHYNLRLAYERAMLEAEGGSAADAEIEPGGWIGKRQIHAVNRSPATKRVVSVKIVAPSGWNENGPPKLKSYNVERLPEGAYRAPTDEERAAFAGETAERKAAEKASRPKAPPLVNPTDEDANLLQAAWNLRAKAEHARRKRYGEFKPSEVLRLTQSQYSANSKGDYAPCETRTLHACGRIARKHTGLWTSEGQAYDKALGETVAKLRIRGSGFDTADRVIVLTDKPQKPIPLDWANLDSPAPAAEPVTVPAEAGAFRGAIDERA
jgi:hypothetical protein